MLHGMHQAHQRILVMPVVCAAACRLVILCTGSITLHVGAPHEEAFI